MNNNSNSEKINVLIRSIPCYDCRNKGQNEECEIYGKIPNSIMYEKESCTFLQK